MQRIAMFGVCFLLLTLASNAQNTDKERLMNVQHALEAYHDCNAMMINLSKISISGRGESKYLFYLGKYYDECLNKYDSAVIIYELYLQKNVSDIDINSRVSSIKNRQDQENKRKSCGRCNGAGYYYTTRLCPNCQGKGKVECPRCQGSGVRSCERCLGLADKREKCRKFYGTGKSYTKCHYCGGDKEVRCDFFVCQKYGAVSYIKNECEH